MPKLYRAYATVSYDLVCEFEVEDEDDAWDIARDIDGDNFTEIPMSADWKIYEVDFIKEIENAELLR